MTGCRTSIRRSKTVSASVTHGVHISHFIGRASHLAAVVSALIRAAMGGWRRSFVQAATAGGPDAADRDA